MLLAVRSCSQRCCRMISVKSEEVGDNELLTLIKHVLIGHWKLSGLE